MATSDDLLATLGLRLDRGDARMRKFSAYYEGNHDLGFASKQFQDAFGSLFKSLVTNFTALVVDSIEERLNVEGFRLGGSLTADADAWSIWQDNCLDAESQLAHSEALVLGRSYLMVWGDDDGDARITVESARQVVVAHQGGDRRRRTAALKRWIEPDGSAFAVLFTPDTVYRYRADGVGTFDPLQWERETPVLLHNLDWRADGEIPNGLGIVPVVPMPNRQRLLGEGESEIAGILGLQDACNKLLADMLVASEFSAFRQKWATGVEIPVDPDTKQAIEPFSAAVSRVWISEDPDSKFGTFDATTLSTYTDALEAVVSHIASQTGLPAHYLLGVRGQHPSGESLRSTEAGLVSRIKRKQRSFGEAWEEAMRLAFLVQGDPRGAEDSRAEVVWKDPENRTEAEHVDALTKLAALGVPNQQLQADAGYSPEQIERFREMRRQESVDTIPVPGTLT